MKSRWLASHSNIPEMNIGEFAKLMKDHFGVLHELVRDQPYWFRFTGPPYNHFVEECRSISVMGHNRGSRLSPHNIIQVLQKFDIKDAQFKDAYNTFFGLSCPGPSSPPPSAEPKQMRKETKPN